jgi:predicted signal transduction protein with EAL and GGDEF domain
LRAFPFDKIKIDASFIKSVDRNEQTAAISGQCLAWGKAFACPSLPKGSRRPANSNSLGPNFVEKAKALFWPTRPIEDFSDLVHGIGHAPTVSGHAETNCLIQS